MDDRLTDFEKRRLRDLSIRVTSPGRPLANSQRVVRCSPDYAERHGTLDTLEQLMQHSACLLQQRHAEPGLTFRTGAFPGASPACLRLATRTLQQQQRPGWRDAALRGQGLALLPLFIVAEDLKNSTPRPACAHSTT